MTDDPCPPQPAAPEPSSAGGAVTVGFLTVTQDSSGVLGGYLVTNAWGRPLEFRLTTAVQPTKVQQALYGPTLAEYLHADLIGKALVDKTCAKADLIVTDSLPALALRARVGTPTVAVGPAPADAPGAVELAHPRAAGPVLLAGKFAGDKQLVEDLLDRLDPAVDLAEPFARVREAIAEARKMGVAGRAA